MSIPVGDWNKLNPEKRLKTRPVYSGEATNDILSNSTVNPIFRLTFYIPLFSPSRFHLHKKFATFLNNLITTLTQWFSTLSQRAPPRLPSAFTVYQHENNSQIDS